MKNCSIIFIILLMTHISGFAQDRSVSGKVTEADGTALPGVNVMIKGSGAGVTTDLDGNYKINVLGSESVLIFSFIGMKTKEEVVGLRSVIDVALNPDISELSEVIVVGYGTMDKKMVTGSISQIEAKDFEVAITQGIDGAMQGRIAGVQVTQNSGTPGGAMSVQVRGLNSISSGTQPLYVIDGVPMTTGNFGQIGFEGQGINALNDLNPNDIESVSVLKDASAGAIYGARGANGVVLITTKSGKKGKSSVNVDSYYGVQQIWRRPSMLNTSQFKQYVNDIATAESRPTPYTSEQIANPAIQTDWIDEILRIATIQNHQVSSSGGNEMTQYYFSGGYFGQEGIVMGTDFQRASARLNVDHKVNDKLNFSVKFNTAYTINQRVPGDQSINGVLPNAISKAPNLGVRDADGNYLEEGFWPNPVAYGTEAVNLTESVRNLANFKWEYKIFPGLKFSNQWGVDFYNLAERRYEPTTVRRGAAANGIALNANTRNTSTLGQTVLSYDTYLNNKHDISALVGFSFEKTFDRGDFIRANDFPSNELQYIRSAGNIETAESFGIDRGLVSFFSRVRYAYDDKYILTLNARIDGSSSFGQNNRYAFLPGFSAGWRLSEEAFLADVSWVDELKLRVGYGRQGNDQITPFSFLSLYSSGFNYFNAPGLVPRQIPNPDLRWETTSSTNVGIDFTTLSNRMTFTIDAYYNVTTDILLNRPIPLSSGFGTVRDNLAELENKGLEFGVNGLLMDKGDFKWDINANISFNRNKILSDVSIIEGRGNNAALQGHPIGVFYMWESLGVDPSTGDLVMRDVNNDGQITVADFAVVGDPNPQFTGGITNSFSYKGFDATFFFQFVYGNEIFNGVRQYTENMTLGANDNQSTRILLRWREPGDIAPVPRINGTFNNEISSHYIEDGSFIRLKNITVGYTLPKSVAQKLKMNKARLYVNGQNLLTFTNYTGMDPEVNYAGAAGIRQGTDFFTFPQPKTVTLGANLSF